VGAYFGVMMLGCNDEWDVGCEGKKESNMTLKFLAWKTGWGGGGSVTIRIGKKKF
jgi:hypothetical protein